MNEAATTAEGEPAGTDEQRIVFHTPTSNAQVALGYNKTTEAHCGFSASVTSSDQTGAGHIWLQAQAASKSTATTTGLPNTQTYQSTNNVLVQSYSHNTYLMPNGSAAFLAGGKAFITSPTSVAFLAGPNNVYSPNEDANASDARDNPTHTQANHSYPDAAVKTANTVAGSITYGWNAAIGALTVYLASVNVIGAKGASSTPQEFARTSWPNIVNSARITALTLASTIKVAGGPGLGAPLAVHSIGGILAGTGVPGFTAVHAPLGVAYRSINSTQCGFLFTALKSLVGNVSLASLQGASIISLGEIEVEAEDSISVLSPRGPVAIEGSKIEVGGHFPVGHHTETVSAVATGNVVATTHHQTTATPEGTTALNAKESVSIGPTPDARTGGSATTPTAKVVANEELKVIVGNAYEILIKSDGSITCGKSGGSGPRIEVTQGSVKVLGPDGENGPTLTTSSNITWKNGGGSLDIFGTGLTRVFGTSSYEIC